MQFRPLPMFSFSGLLQDRKLKKFVDAVLTSIPLETKFLYLPIHMAIDFRRYDCDARVRLSLTSFQYATARVNCQATPILGWHFHLPLSARPAQQQPQYSAEQASVLKEMDAYFEETENNLNMDEVQMNHGWSTRNQVGFLFGERFRQPPNVHIPHPNVNPDFEVA